jgi:hypothetical protein
MLSWIIQITIISFVLIFLVHHLINFFKTTLTVPKIKDLVNSPTQKYQNMYSIINNNDNNSNYNVSNTNSSDNEYTLIDLLPKKDENNMKSELKNFLKSQLNTSNTNFNTNISSLDSLKNDGISYSNY